ncbi:MAG TPA: porin family protein [Gemmatimonadaceae bacterium]|nr:porin family protein [Gemmatimonadaceae bacterium]
MQVTTVPFARLLACSIALSAVATTSSAQTDTSGTTTPTVPAGNQSITTPGAFQFGLEGGVSIANFIADTPFETRNRRGPYGGVTLIVQPQASALGFQTGVLFVTKGVRNGDSNGDESSITGGVKLSYLEVPLMVRLGIPLSFAGIAPTLVAGGSIGYRIGCRVEARGLGLSTDFDCDDALAIDTFDAKRFDGGVTVGVEMPVAIGGRVIVVPTVRYTRGLVNIVEGSGAEVKNSALQLGFGLRFR